MPKSRFDLTDRNCELSSCGKPLLEGTKPDCYNIGPGCWGHFCSQECANAALRGEGTTIDKLQTKEDFDRFLDAAEKLHDSGVTPSQRKDDQLIAEVMNSRYRL